MEDPSGLRMRNMLGVELVVGGYPKMILLRQVPEDTGNRRRRSI
jgi:hypothetical protein